MKQFERPFNNRKGVSIASALIGAGLISIISLASLSLFNTNLLQQKFIDQKYAVTHLHREIYEYLSNAQNCRATFTATGQVLNRDAIDDAGEEFVFSAIKSPDGTSDVFKKYVSSGDPTYNNNLIRIDDLKVNGFQDLGLDANNRYVATAMLEIKYKQNSRTLGTETFRPKQLKINFIFRRTDTTAPAGPDVANDKEILTCKSIGGSGDSFWNLNATGEGIFYNEKVSLGVNAPAANVKFEVQDNQLNGIAGRFVNRNATNSNGIYIQTENTNPVDLGLLVQSNAGANDVFAIRNSGQVGIGTRSPASTLDVRGEIRMGNSAIACSAVNEGAIRYNSTLKLMEFCNGTPPWRVMGSNTIFSGTAIVSWNNGSTTSNMSAAIAVPGGCSSPKVFVRAQSDSIMCFPSPCPADPSSSSQDIHAYSSNPGASFVVYLSGSSGAAVPVGSTYNIDWLLVCN